MELGVFQKQGQWTIPGSGSNNSPGAKQKQKVMVNGHVIVSRGEEKKAKPSSMTDSRAPFAKQEFYFATFDKVVVNKHMDELILCANIFYPNWTTSIGGAPKYISTEGLNPLRRVPIWVKTKMIQRMNSDGGLLSIHSKHHLLQPKLDKCASFFKHSSLTRGAVTIT